MSMVRGRSTIRTSCPAFLAEMQAFTDHIRTGTHPADLTVYDGTAVSEAAYRCKESFETGKMLPIR